MGDFTNLQNRVQMTLEQVNSRLAIGPIQSAPLALEEKDRQQIRQLVGKPSVVGAKPLAQVGETVPDFMILQPFPGSLINQIASLKGTRFALDPGSGLIYIVSNRDNRIVAIVA